MVTVESVGKEASLEEPKVLVEAYLKKQFKKKHQVYPSDAADALGLDYQTVRQVFKDLEEEGKIQESG
jgi:predicted ArsR family transcriptional regulator